MSYNYSRLAPELLLRYAAQRIKQDDLCIVDAIAVCIIIL